MENKNICFSGGAVGADSTWGIIAKENDHEVVHFIFQNHRSKEDNTEILSKELLQLADPFLVKANEVLKRSFPTKNEYVNDLLRRNYYQIKDSDSLYAVSTLKEDGNVDGGTAWAVEMFIQNREGPVYLYDQVKEVWFEYDRINGGFIMIEFPPTPSGKWTGVGSRKITEDAKEAMINIF